MKRIVLSTVFLLFSLHSLQAQLSSKKTAIEFTDNHALNLGNIYSVNNNTIQGNYVIIQSDVEVPVTYEPYTYHPIENNTDDNNMGTDIQAEENHTKFSDQGLANLQAFAVFTIVDTNSLSDDIVEDDISGLDPDFKKFLPKGFNPYHGMFKSDTYSKSLQNPITVR
ncbi:hypothetical protein [Formosa haliotis]|uniref:hypothetical protein n=1 Tax=Formosa haliotis TaxID=1555194 RepID=UPI00082429C2|nr:hypothetical protein [Formosa haliotis]